MDGGKTISFHRLVLHAEEAEEESAAKQMNGGASSSSAPKKKKTLLKRNGVIRFGLRLFLFLFSWQCHCSDGNAAEIYCYEAFVVLGLDFTIQKRSGVNVYNFPHHYG